MAQLVAVIVTVTEGVVHCCRYHPCCRLLVTAAEPQELALQELAHPLAKE
jgi:hypothetical protein